jgi:hypothetical protein
VFYALDRRPFLESGFELATSSQMKRFNRQRLDIIRPPSSRAANLGAGIWGDFGAPLCANRSSVSTRAEEIKLISESSQYYADL